MALLNKVSGRKGIGISVSTGKSLVGHVEERKVALLLHDVANLAPLVLGRVDTGRVVSTGMEQDDAVVGGGPEVLDQAVKVKTNGVLVVVTVLLDLQARVLEDSVVVGPAGGRKVDLLRAGEEAVEECTADSQSTSSGDGLSDDEAVLLQDSRVDSVGQLGCSLGERGNASDSSIFLIVARCDNLVLGGTNGGQNEGLSLVVTCTGGLAIVVKRLRLRSCKPSLKGRKREQAGFLTVSTNTQVDLLFERIGLVGFGDTKDSVLQEPRCQKLHDMMTETN